MNEIDIYTTAVCGYCVAAKNYLRSRGLTWNEKRIDTDPSLREEMQRRAPGSRTVPQIFINDSHVGGYDDMMAKVRDGSLETLLQAPE